MPSIVGILLCTCLAFALSGCGDDKPSGGSDKTASSPATKAPRGTTYDASTKPRDATIRIALKSTGMAPQYVTARAGQTIVWTNEDDVRHRVESTDGPDFPSRTLAKGETLEYKLRPHAQTPWIRYVCSIHPAKIGGFTTIVEE